MQVAMLGMISTNKSQASTIYVISNTDSGYKIMIL